MNPHKSILNPQFKYTNSSSTDLAKTFARARKELEKQQKPANVTTLRKKEA